MAFNPDTLGAARKQGYTDEEIYSHLVQTDPRFATAKEHGYTLDEVAAHFAPKADVAQVNQAASSPATTKAEDYSKFLYHDVTRGDETLGGERSTLTGKQAFVQGVTQPIVELPKPQGEGVVSGVVRGAENVAEGLLTHANILGAAATAVVPKPIQQLIAAGFGGAMVKEVPEQIMEGVEAKTPGAKAEKLTEAILGAAMGGLALKHGLGKPEVVNSNLKKAGLTNEQINQLNTKLEQQRLVPQATPEGKEFPFTDDEIVDGLHHAKDALVKDFNKQPPEIQKQRQAVLDTIESQLLEVPREQVNASRERTARQPPPSPPEAPAEGGGTPPSPSVESSRSKLFEQLKAADAGETAKAVVNLPEPTTPEPTGGDVNEKPSQPSPGENREGRPLPNEQDRLPAQEADAGPTPQRPPEGERGGQPPVDDGQLLTEEQPKGGEPNEIQKDRPELQAGQTQEHGDVQAGQGDQAQVTPAIRTPDGQVFTGTDHVAAYETAKQTVPDTSGSQEGFVDAQGNFQSREQAAAETGLPTNVEPGKLHSSDLDTASQVNAWVEQMRKPEGSIGRAEPEEVMAEIEDMEPQDREALANHLQVENDPAAIMEKLEGLSEALKEKKTEPTPEDFLPEPEDYGLPKTKLGGGGTMTRRIAPLGITPKLPPFLDAIANVLSGIANLPELKELGQSFRGLMGQLAGKTFPKLSVLNRELGELGARWISSRIAARPSGMMFATQVLEGLDIDPVKFGTALHEDNLRSIRNGFEKAGELDKAAEVKTTIGGKGSPFKTEDEYQAFLNDVKTQQAIERHKALWDSIIDPQYKKAMSIDPDEVLPPRGLQTGARINLNPIMEGEKQGNKVFTVGQGNLLGTMRRKSIFGRQAKGTGEAYGMNYFDTMTNTFGRQLEIANKNAFEDALVKNGYAKVDRPGQQIEINGREAKSYPYKRQPLILPGEPTKAVPQSRNLYIDPRIQSEYESGANILRSGIAQNKIVSGVNTILNNAALTGLTDATVHVSNLGSALFTRPALSSPVLADTLLSAAGRADVWVTAVRSIMKGFGPGAFKVRAAEQLKQLAEIGALRADHPKGSMLSPLNWTSTAIRWADTTARLALDDAYKRMADAGLVEKSETNRREFVNQVGQYNKRAQGPFVRLLRDSGFSPFVTAGKTFNALAVRTATLDPGLKASSVPAAMMLRANVLSKWVGAAALVTTANYLITGKVAGRPGVPLGAIDTGKDDKNGRPLYVKVFDMLGLMRAGRITGARGAIEAKRLGLTDQDALDSATRDVFNTVTAPFVGPPLRFAATVGNIPTAIDVGKPVPSVAPGESQRVANVKQAVVQASPLAASLVDRSKTGGSLMEAAQRQLPRYLPQSGKAPEMMEKYPQIVHRAQARSFTSDVIGAARKMEPEARKAFIEDAMNRLKPEDIPQFRRTLKYSHIDF